MKRFFSRFSTVPSPSPTKPVQDARFDCSEKKDLDAVAPAPALPAPYNHLGRTKALVAKFEGASLSQSASLSPSDTTPDITPDRFPPTIPIEQTGPPVLNTAANPSRSILPSDVVASVPKRLPGSSLPAESGRQSDLVALDTPETKTPRCPDQGTHQRQSSSCPQAGPSATHLSKSVAFAPSPQKQRSLSPVPVAQPQRSATSQPLLRTSSSDSSDPNAASSNFARPTAASQARSRTWTRSAASDVSQRIASPNSHTSRDKAPLSFARSARPSQASSTRFTSRRSHSYSSAPSADGNPSASGLTSSLAVKRLASSARRDSMEAASSNPSESPNLGAGPADVSSGPLHFPSRTSLSMRFSYSGSASSRPQSRRNSVDPASPITTNETVAFPPSAFAARPYGFPTWSEMTQEELVRNLGPRERTRQEVLWEIVASEERYLAELEKAKEIYIDALLHPHLFDPERVLPPAPSTLTAFPIDEPGPRNSAASKPQLVPMLPANSNGEPSAFAAGSLPNTHGDLPIASRFMSNISVEKSAAFESIGRGTQPHNAARSPYLGHMGSASTTDNVSSRSGPVTMRVHASFGLGLGLGTTATRDRSTAGYMNVTTTTRAKGKLSKAQKLRGLSRKAKADADADPLRLSVPLPPSLREVLVAMSDVLVEAHGMLSDALKARYEEQWPLVRSLADIFTKYAHIFQRYATYVCHLQRAMEELEEAALMERAFRGKRLKKERLSNTVGLGRTVAALEACAAEQGYAGLSIFASMPFQRLLKYPLLFQNLLFHTDPSTTEFESTVSMVVDIERLVRSIEDEKVNAEERDKMLDCFARIDGITDHQVLRPRPDRVLIEEQALYDQNARRALSESAPKGARADAYPSDSENGESGAENTEPSGGRWSNSNQSGLRAALRNKRSYRRLSDFLPSEDAGHGSSKAPSMGSKKDLWIVRFSDVEIKCQRIGVTALPMVSTAALRIADSSAELDASDFAARTKDSRERLKALRNTTLRAKTRNLYKFISVVAWRNAAARQAGIGKEDSVGGLPTSHEVDEQDSVEGEEEDEASVDSDDGSSVSSSSSSGSDDGIGGQAASQKYVRSTKLSFTYWGDRIEPSRGIAGAQAGAHANDPPKISSGHISNQRNDGPVSRTTGPRLTASADSAVTSAAGAAPTFDSTRSSRQPQTSTLDGASLNLSQIHGRRGVLGRLSEPMAATSMSIAPEPMQNAVAQMHARQRNEKFGARLRSSIANGADDSHVSVDLAGVDAGGVSRAGNRTSLAASGPRAI